MKGTDHTASYYAVLSTPLLLPLRTIYLTQHPILLHRHTKFYKCKTCIF